MNKMQMAHDWAMRCNRADLTMKGFVDLAWQYADAMQAEAEERNKAEAAQKRKEIREILNDANTFIEREGQHFDEVEEWQPDWSQAPDGYNWWAADQRGCYWYDREPEWIDNEWGGYTINKNNRSVAKQISSLGYIGNWKNSLRKRPEALQPEVDWRLAPNDAIGWMIFDGVSTWLGESGFLIEDAPSFGFTGTHIMERPQ